MTVSDRKWREMDADDVRDTLSDKLLRYLHRECPKQLVIHDHLINESDVTPLQGMTFTKDLNTTVEEADLIFIATNHSLYTEQRDLILTNVLEKRCRVVDLWNSLQTETVFLD